MTGVTPRAVIPSAVTPSAVTPSAVLAKKIDLRDGLRSPGADGFTLIETLVAFLIAAAVLSILFGSMTRMMLGDRRAKEMREALMLARARLAEIGGTGAFVPGESSGVTPDGYRWRASLSPESSAGAGAGAAFWIEVSVTAPGDPAQKNPASVTLSSLRLPPQRRQ